MRSTIARRIGGTMGLALGGLLASATLARAACPQTCYEYGTPLTCTSASSLDMVSSWSGGYAEAKYDLARGTSYVDADWQDWAEVDATDRYALVGPRDGTVVDLTAHLALQGYTEEVCTGSLYCAHATASASLADSSGATVTMNVNVELRPTLSLPLTEQVGHPFVLVWHTQATGAVGDVQGAGAAEWATLSFDLPPGVGIVSCAGYTTGSVTAASRGSWGTLKIRYR